MIKSNVDCGLTIQEEHLLPSSYNRKQLFYLIIDYCLYLCCIYVCKINIALKSKQNKMSISFNMKSDFYNVIPFSQ